MTKLKIIALIWLMLVLNACGDDNAAQKTEKANIKQVDQDVAPANETAAVLEKTESSDTVVDTVVDDTVDANNEAEAVDDQQDDPIKLSEEFENRKIYTELNGEIIKTIKDELLEQAIVDYVLLKVDEDPEKAYDIVTALPEGFVTVFATWEVEAEVNNGGFDQYLYNTSGEFALEAAEGFEKIGAKTFAKLTQQALDISLKEMAKMAEPDLKPDDGKEANNTAGVALDKLDEDYFNNDENISVLRIKYIRDHLSLFDVNKDAKNKVKAEIKSSDAEEEGKTENNVDAVKPTEKVTAVDEAKMKVDSSDKPELKKENKTTDDVKTTNTSTLEKPTADKKPLSTEDPKAATPSSTTKATSSMDKIIEEMKRNAAKTK